MRDRRQTGSFSRGFLHQPLDQVRFIDGNYVRLRDSDAIDELTDGFVNLAFIGSDVLGELSVEQITVIDEFVPEKINQDGDETRPRFVLMGLPGADTLFDNSLIDGTKLSVATSIPKQLGAFAARIGLQLGAVRIAKGSVESYPARNRTDLAFDIVETGKTMRATKLISVREGSLLSVNVLTGIKVAPQA